MSAPTHARPLCTDAELRRRLAHPDGVRLRSTDPRLAGMYAAGLIEPFGDRWRLVVRHPSRLTADQRAFVADDAAATRREDL